MNKNNLMTNCKQESNNLSLWLSNLINEMYSYSISWLDSRVILE